MALIWKVLVNWLGTALLNLVSNPSLETNLTGWSTTGTFDINARSTEQAYVGSYSYKLRNLSGSDANVWTTFTASAATSTISIWVYRSSGSGALTLYLQENFAPFGVIASVVIPNTTGVWQRVTVTGATTATSSYRLRLLAANSNLFYLDAAQAEAGAVMTPYYDGAVGDESDNLTHIRTTRGRSHLVRGANGFEPMRVGEAILTLRNIDGRYDPLNTSSPLYGAVEPGKEVSISVSDGTAYNVFRGHIEDIRPIGTTGPNRVKMVVRDGWQWLKDRKVRAATQTNYRTDQAINAIQSAAGYPFSTSLYTGSDTIPYWWAGDRDAMQEIQSVVDSEFGLCWIAADGTLTFRRRPYQWLLSASHTLTGTNINELNFAQPWDVVRNVIQVKAYPTEVRANQVLWRSSAPIRVKPGGSKTLVVDYSLQTSQDQTGLATDVRVGAASVLSLVPSSDYIVYANPGGTGDNLTALISIAVTNLGEQARLVITNSSATRTAYITLLKLRGSVIIKNNPVAVEADVSGSDPDRSFVLDVPWQQDIERSELYADYLATYMSDPRAAPTVRTCIAGLAIQCAELFTGIQFTIASLGLSAKLYRLCGVDHEWSALSPNILDTQLHLERKDEQTYFTLNTSTVNGSHVLAY